MEKNYNTLANVHHFSQHPYPYNLSLSFPFVLFSVHTEKTGKGSLILLPPRKMSGPGVELEGLYMNF